MTRPPGTYTASFTGLKQLETDFYQASFDMILTSVNVFVIDDPRDGLIVIDSSAPRLEDAENPIIQALAQLGKVPQDVRHLMLTHAHPDHIGNAGEFQALSGASVWMNPQGAGILEAEHPTIRPVKIRGGGVRETKLAIGRATVQHKIVDGQRLDLAGGIDVIDTIGHSADHQSFLWHRHGGVMIVGDAVTNEKGLMAFAPFYDDADEEMRSVEKIGGCAFEKMAFGHGDYIAHGAKEQFLRRWARQGG